MSSSENDWRQRAACKDVDPELFFPLGQPGVAPDAQVDRAKAVCSWCPVKASCLTWALDNGVDHGVWGGTDPDERRELRNRSPRRPGWKAA